MKELILLITILSCGALVFNTIQSIRISTKEESFEDCLNGINKFPAIIIPLECGILLLIIDSINFDLRFIIICIIIIVINIMMMQNVTVLIKYLLKNGGEK